MIGTRTRLIKLDLPEALKDPANDFSPATQTIQL
jgi:hypothetical protein